LGSTKYASAWAWVMRIASIVWTPNFWNDFITQSRKVLPQSIRMFLVLPSGWAYRIRAQGLFRMFLLCGSSRQFLQILHCTAGLITHCNQGTPVELPAPKIAKDEDLLTWWFSVGSDWPLTSGSTRLWAIAAFASSILRVCVFDWADFLNRIPGSACKWVKFRPNSSSAKDVGRPRIHGKLGRGDRFMA